MSPARRFAGAGAAALVLLAVAAAWWWVRVPAADPVEPAAIFRFEKEDLVGIRVIRADGTLAFERTDAGWTTVGEAWRPQASMIRRIGHQLHDLTARATVVESPEDPALYGLDDRAIRVELALRDGRSLAFAVGDPNPSSVSWYVQELPDGPVHVVKKAAVDYYRLDRDAFREDRFAFFDAADAEAIRIRVAGEVRAFRRVDAQSWEMTEPHRWRADRDAIRRILGAVSAARALAFVADAPESFEPWGLGEGADRVVVELSSGEPVTLVLGDGVPGSDPLQRYVFRVEDGAVYAVRAAIAAPIAAPIESFRDPRLVGRPAFEVRSLRVERGSDVVALQSTADTWRWEEGAEVPGSTPRRVAAAAAELRALRFHDEVPGDAGLDAPTARVVLGFEDGQTAELALGSEGAVGRYATRAGDPVVYEVGPELDDRIEDLLRERARWLDKQAERR